MATAVKLNMAQVPDLLSTDVCHSPDILQGVSALFSMQNVTPLHVSSVQNSYSNIDSTNPSSVPGFSMSLFNNQSASNIEEPMETEDYPVQVAAPSPNVGTVVQPSNVQQSHNFRAQVTSGQTLPSFATKIPQNTENEDNCVICMDSFEDKVALPKCSHEFCKECIEQQFKYKKSCPVCGTVYGKITGNQPKGTIRIQRIKGTLPGYEQHQVISVSYSFPNGTQTSEHPHPGVKYSGTSRTGYFPDSPEGIKIVRLLKVAFDRRLVFTVGRSRTTGADNVVTWNDIHHKTAFSGGPENFAYPDPTYFSRVLEELAAKGVTKDELQHEPELIL